MTRMFLFNPPGGDEDRPFSPYSWCEAGHWVHDDQLAGGCHDLCTFHVNDYTCQHCGTVDCRDPLCVEQEAIQEDWPEDPSTGL